MQKIFKNLLVIYKIKIRKRNWLLNMIPLVLNMIPQVEKKGDQNQKNNYYRGKLFLIWKNKLVVGNYFCEQTIIFYIVTSARHDPTSIKAFTEDGLWGNEHTSRMHKLDRNFWG